MNKYRELVERWIYRGFELSIYKIAYLEHLCGYIALPEHTRFAGMSTNDLDKLLDLHGGITYHERNVIGFDTHHAGDVSEDGMPNKDVMYVIDQLETAVRRLDPIKELF